MKKTLHRILYRTLPLEGYLRAVSRLFFLWQRLGLGRRAPETEYVYHLPQLVRAGDTCIDIGANLGYYARTISRLAGPAGRVYAVEPVAPIRKVLSRNLRRCGNTEILPFALGAAAGPIRMGNDSARENGYFGTGRNFVNEGGDIEGYEAVVMEEMRPLLERFRPTVLIETGGENRPRIVRLFTRLGYAGYTLDRGREIPLSPGSTKDIIFRPGAERPEDR